MVNGYKISDQLHVVVESFIFQRNFIVNQETFNIQSSN